MHTARSASQRAAAAVVAVLLLALTACSGRADVATDPETALESAVQTLGGYGGIELAFDIGGDRQAVASATGAEADAAAVRFLLDSTVTVRGTAGGSGGELEDAEDEAEVSVELAGERALELRALGTRLFARLDVDAVDDPDLTRTLDGLIVGAERFGAREFGASVRSGRWIEFRGLEQLAAFTGTSDADTTAGTDSVEDARERLTAALEGFLAEGVELTHRGQDEAGERLTATISRAQLRRLVEEATSLATELGGVAPRVLGLDRLGPDPSRDRSGDGDPVTVDLWIADGHLRRLSLDLAALQPGASGATLLVDIDEFTGTITAPEGATEIDPFTVLRDLIGGAFRGASPDTP